MIAARLSLVHVLGLNNSIKITQEEGVEGESTYFYASAVYFGGECTPCPPALDAALLKFLDFQDTKA